MQAQSDGSQTSETSETGHAASTLTALAAPASRMAFSARAKPLSHSLPDDRWDSLSPPHGTPRPHQQREQQQLRQQQPAASSIGTSGPLSLVPPNICAQISLDRQRPGSASVIPHHLSRIPVSGPPTLPLPQRSSAHLAHAAHASHDAQMLGHAAAAAGSAPAAMRPQQQLQPRLQRPAQQSSAPATAGRSGPRPRASAATSMAGTGALQPDGVTAAAAALVPAVVLTEGMCSHDPTSTSSAGQKRRRAESDPTQAVGATTSGNANDMDEDDVNSIGQDDQDDSSTGARRRRMMWTPQLHARFLNAVTHLGPTRAVPKSILGLMNVEGLTRENVASHLQKYRAYLRRVSGLPPGAHLPPGAFANAGVDAQWGRFGFDIGGRQGSADPIAPQGFSEALTPWQPQSSYTGAPRHIAPPASHLLSQQAAPIQPLDVRAALAHEVEGETGESAGALPCDDSGSSRQRSSRDNEGGGHLGNWGPAGARLANMGYAGLPGVPHSELPVFGTALAASGAALVAGWQYPPLPSDLLSPPQLLSSGHPTGDSTGAAAPAGGALPAGAEASQGSGLYPSASAVLVTRQLDSAQLTDSLQHRALSPAPRPQQPPTPRQR